MANTNLLQALTRKHEAILAEIRAVEKTIKTTHKHMESLEEREGVAARLYRDLEHVLAVIKMDHPEYDEGRAQARGKNTYKLPLPIGQCTRFAFEIIRESDKSLTINEIAHEVLRRSEMVDLDVETSRLACNNINSSFRARLGKTLGHDEQYPQRWWVVGSDADPNTTRA